MFIVAPINCANSVHIPWFVIQYSLFCDCNHLDEEERASCFTVIVLLMSCDCKCSVALLCDAVGWSTVCEYCISGHTHLRF